MKYSIQDIPKLWDLNKPGQNSTGNFKTDGNNLYSYALLIGITKEDKKILFRYKSPDHFVSQTTSTHVTKASSYADVIIPPDTLNI